MRVVLLALLLTAAPAICPVNLFAGQSSRESQSDELKQEPKQTRRLLEAALRLEKEGQTASAIAAFGELLRQAPSDPIALRHRAQLLLQSGHIEAASHDLSVLLVGHPEDGAAWSGYGDCMRALRRDKDAAGAYRKAMENGENTATVNRKRGDVLAAAGENEAALDAYSSAIRLRLDNPESYFVRGVLLMDMKRDRDAIDDFTRAIDFNPDYADAYYRRGRAWGDLSQFADAVRDLTAFLRMKPGDAQALSYRGAALDTLGRIDEALQDYAGALKADPANSRVFTARAELYTRLGRYAEALADRDRAIALDPLNAYFYMARGGTQLALGNKQKAVADRTRAVELAPGNAMMWYSRATTYAALGQNDKALNDAAEALRHNPGFEAARRLADELQSAQAPNRLKLSAALASGGQPAVEIQQGTPANGAAAGRPAVHTSGITPSTEQPHHVAEAPAPVARPGLKSTAAAPISSSPHEIVLPRPTQTPVSAPQAPRRPQQPDVERPARASEPSPQSLYKQGRALLDRGDFDAAAAKLAQAASHETGNPLIWNALGYCRMRQKQYKQALEALNRAIALDPRYQNAYLNRSAVKHLLGDGSGSARDRIQAQLLAKRH